MVQTIRLAKVDFTCFKAGKSNLLQNVYLVFVKRNVIPYFKISRSIRWFVPLPVG